MDWGINNLADTINSIVDILLTIINAIIAIFGAVDDGGTGEGEGA